MRPEVPDVDGACELYRNALLIDDVLPNDHLFDLGGHSLLAARIVADLYKRYGLSVSLTDFLEEPTPQKLARLAAAASDAA